MPRGYRLSYTTPGAIRPSDGMADVVGSNPTALAGITVRVCGWAPISGKVSSRRSLGRLNWLALLFYYGGSSLIVEHSAVNREARGQNPELPHPKDGSARSYPIYVAVLSILLRCGGVGGSSIFK